MRASYFSKHLPTGVGLLMLIVFAATGCERKQSRLEATRAGLQQLLANMEKNWEGTSTQVYLKTAYNEALKKIDGRQELRPDEVILISAEISIKKTQYGDRPAVTLQWMEDEFQVKDFFFVSADGDTHQSHDVLSWNEDDEEWFAAGVWRDTWIPLVTDDASAAAWKADPNRWTPVKVPPQLIAESTRVGLITDDGKRSNTVPILIAQLDTESTEDEQADQR